MAYSDVAALAADRDFSLRTQACYATEPGTDPSGSNPSDWQADHAWSMAAQPGFGDAYASAVAGGVARPGNDPAVISDAQILGAVQSLLAAPAA
jgi:hypothetical protein